jgi:protein-tyrosine phosphatase
MASEAPERSIPFESVFNFRDLGGYRAAGGRSVRWRRLFRADGLHRLTEAEADLVAHLGLSTVVDLRTPEETTRGRFPESLGPIRYHHLPMFDVIPDWSQLPDVQSPWFMANRYAEMLDTGRDALAGVLVLLADPDAYPLVFHCAAGKDRTGIVAAVVLELLGVDRATVVADYALSHAAMARLEAWIAERHPDWARSDTRPPAVIEARPETMEQFLSVVDERFGSVEGLVADLGVAGGVIESLRANLLG